MFVDLLEYEWVLKPVVEFENMADLQALLPHRIIEPAEKRVASRQKQLRQWLGGLNNLMIPRINEDLCEKGTIPACLTVNVVELPRH